MAGIISSNSVPNGLPRIDVNRNRYPYCIVWGTLPLISWCFPFIGHMGIADSEGKIHDFAGPYFIGIDRFMTGSVMKYVQMDPTEVLHLHSDTEAAEKWDKCVQEADGEFKLQMHNICCNNCHDHTARALNLMGLNTSMLGTWWLMMTRGKYVSWGSLLATYLPLLIIVGIICAASLVKIN